MDDYGFEDYGMNDYETSEYMMDDVEQIDDEEILEEKKEQDIVFEYENSSNFAGLSKYILVKDGLKYYAIYVSTLNHILTFEEIMSGTDSYGDELNIYKIERTKEEVMDFQEIFRKKTIYWDRYNVRGVEDKSDFWKIYDVDIDNIFEGNTDPDNFEEVEEIILDFFGR